MADQEREDLSQLKGPVAWGQLCERFLMVGLITVIGCSAVLMLVLKIMDEPFSSYAKLLRWFAIPAALLTAFVVNFRVWWTRNYLGHKVCWWRNEDGKWQVTTDFLRERTWGPAIQVHVKAWPEFTLWWVCRLASIKAWRLVKEDDREWLVSRSGERLDPKNTDRGTLEKEGLTQEVIAFLRNPWSWKIIPRDAGRVLRFEDMYGVGMEFRYDEVGTDLEEILRAMSCSAYRMVQRIDMRDLRTERDALRQAREETWQWLCRLLNFLREEAKQATRPPAKIVALWTMDWILTWLLGELPSDHQLRRDYGVSAQELERVRARLAEERARVTPKRDKATRDPAEGGAVGG